MIVLPFVIAGCGLPGLEDNGSNTIKIGAQSTTEGEIMAAVIQKMIEHYDPKIKTELISNLGSGNVSFQAQKRGDIDMSSIRYTGTDYQTILNAKDGKNADYINKYVRDKFKHKYHMTYFPTYGFADTYQFMVTQKYAKQHHIKTVSDLKKLSSKMKVGVDQIWADRRGDGYDGFKKKYGFGFGHLYQMQIGLVYDALDNNKMDSVLGYSTDGRIRSYHLKLLKDDKHFFPPYDAAMSVNDKALKKYPKLGSILHRLDNKVTLSKIQQLNYEVDNNFKEPSVVANEFVKQNHYFDGGKH